MKIQTDDCGFYYLEKPKNGKGKNINDQIEGIVQAETLRLSSVISQLVEEYITGGDVYQVVETFHNAGLTRDEIEGYVGTDEVEYSGYFN